MHNFKKRVRIFKKKHKRQCNNYNSSWLKKDTLINKKNITIGQKNTSQKTFSYVKNFSSPIAPSLKEHNSFFLFLRQGTVNQKSKPNASNFWSAKQKKIPRAGSIRYPPESFQARPRAATSSRAQFPSTGVWRWTWSESFLIEQYQHHRQAELSYLDFEKQGHTGWIFNGFYFKQQIPNSKLQNYFTHKKYPKNY